MTESPFILEVMSPTGRLSTPLHAKENAFMLGNEWFTGPALRPMQCWALNAWLDHDEAAANIIYLMIETPTTTGEVNVYFETENAWTLAKWRVTDETGRLVEWQEIHDFFNPKGE